jgi:hypothetical protein
MVRGFAPIFLVLAGCVDPNAQPSGSCPETETTEEFLAPDLRVKTWDADVDDAQPVLMNTDGGPSALCVASCGSDVLACLDTHACDGGTCVTCTLPNMCAPLE